MKKLLLLGGSPQQVIAIEKAKQLGYYTVLCDYLPDNPGQYAAQKFYPVSTTDRQAVLEVARQEQAQGVLAYASDPAAPTAAFVAQEMGLPGNPLNEDMDPGKKCRRILPGGIFPSLCWSSPWTLPAAREYPFFSKPNTQSPPWKMHCPFPAAAVSLWRNTSKRRTPI